MSEKSEDTNQNRKSKKDSLHAGATMAKQRDQRTNWSTKDPTKVEQELLTLPEHLSFRGVRVTRSLVFCVMFWRSLFVLLSFYFWPLCCLSFFDLRILSTPFVSSNSSIKNRPFIYHICIYNIFHKRIPCIDSLIMRKITEVCCLLK
jgi:hypothetical protein